MNFDDPSELTPHLFRFTDLQNPHACVRGVHILRGNAPSGLDMVPDAPLPGAAPQASRVRALRAHYFILSFHNFSPKTRPRRGHTQAAQGEALGKRNHQKNKALKERHIEKRQNEF